MQSFELLHANTTFFTYCFMNLQENDKYEYKIKGFKIEQTKIIWVFQRKVKNWFVKKSKC